MGPVPGLDRSPATTNEAKEFRVMEQPCSAVLPVVRGLADLVVESTVRRLVIRIIQTHTLRSISAASLG